MFIHRSLIQTILLSFLLAACGNSGDTAKFDEAFLEKNIQAPTTPDGLTLMVVSGTRINLSWTESRDNAGIKEYAIYRDGSALKTLTTTSTSDMSLTPATKYCYQVSAVDNAGNASTKSAEVCGTTQDTIAPNVPTNLTLTVVSATQLDLSWTAPIDNVGVTGYKVYRDGVLLKNVTTTATSDTGITQATNYCYTVSAMDTAGNESAVSTQVCGTTPDATPPAQPEGLLVSAVSETRINLAWTASSDNVDVTGYKVYRGGTFLKNVTTITTSDTGLIVVTQYCYQISAVDAAGNESTKSTQICATTPDATSPSQPSGLTLTLASATQIDLSWSAPTDNVGVTGYKVYRGGVLLKNVTSTATSDTGLTQGSQYCYQVSALDAANNESALITQKCIIIDVTPPSVPTGLAATAASMTIINLSWTASTDNLGVSGYNIYRGGTLITTVTDTVYFDSGLTKSTNYCYTVAAVDTGNNASGQCTQECATTTNFTPLVDTGQITVYMAGDDASFTFDPPSYTDNGNNTITDNVTGLQWQKWDAGTTSAWDAANTYCSGLSLAGTGWRLPTHLELMSIVDYGKHTPAINSTYFPSTLSYYYWSSTISASDSMSVWIVNFFDGFVIDDVKTYPHYARCVR